MVTFSPDDQILNIEASLVIGSNSKAQAQCEKASDEE
jgi:hypothetical protein